MANEFDFHKSLLSRIENGVTEAKIGSVWTIAEALDIKMSDLFKIVEKKLPENFKIMDE